MSGFLLYRSFGERFMFVFANIVVL